MKQQQIDDICIIGMGATGLYAWYCANLLSLKGTAIESNHEIGGQVNELASERIIYDLPCVIKTNGKKITNMLRTQVKSTINTVQLIKHASVLHLETMPSGYHKITLSNNSIISTKHILITVGNGAYLPRRWGLPSFDNAIYRIVRKKKFCDKTIVVCGGGDAALNTALSLVTGKNCAKKVIIVHRNSRFRAKPTLVNEIMKHPCIDVYIDYQIDTQNYESINGNLISIQIKKISGIKEILIADFFIIKYGVAMNLIGVKNWPLRFTSNNKILVNQRQETSISGIYAAGDAADYSGKIPNLTIGFGEAATALYNIYKKINIDDPVRYFGDHKTF